MRIASRREGKKKNEAKTRKSKLKVDDARRPGGKTKTTAMMTQVV
jgi:hypothetical protein